MVGTPGYPWPPFSAPLAGDGESQRVHLEAALRALREQRPQIAAEIGEFLYSLVLQGTLRDPVVLETCRRLYDHEQQVVALETSLRALSVAPPVSQSPVFQPAPPPSRPPGFTPGVPATGSEGPATVIRPPAVEDGATQISPPGSRLGTGPLSGVAPYRDSRPPAPLPADLEGEGETVISPVRRPDPAPVANPRATKGPERHCSHCRMPLRASDTVCPVCGRPAGEPAPQALQCRRCGTELRAQDRSCPVCGTPRA